MNGTSSVSFDTLLRAADDVPSGAEVTDVRWAGSDVMIDWSYPDSE